MGLGSVRNAVIQQSQQPQSVGGKGAQQPQSVGGKGAQPQQSGRGEFNYGFGSMPQQSQPQRVGGKGIGQAVTNFQRQSQFPAPRDMYAGMPSPQSSFGFQQNPYAAPFNQYMGGNQPSQQMSPYVSSYYMPQPQMYQQPMYQQPMYQQPQQMGGKGGFGGNPYARQPYQPPQQMGGKGGIPGLDQPPGASFPDRALHDVPMDMRYRGPYIDTSAMRAQREMQARNAEQMVRQGMPSIIRSRQPTQAAQSSITPQDILSMAVRKTPADLRYDANNDGRITSADALAFSKGWRPQAMKKGGEVK